MDAHYLQAERMVLVLDTLNITVPSALYETFAPQEARRLVERQELHDTPKPGSWLNMAEIELAALSQQRLDHCRVQRPTPHSSFWQANCLSERGEDMASQGGQYRKEAT